MTELVDAPVVDSTMTDSSLRSAAIDESVATIAEVLALIDRGLGDFSERQLLSSAEVSDLLLDVRSLLTRSEVSAN